MKKRLFYQLSILFIMLFGSVNAQNNTINMASYNLRLETINDGENTWALRRDFVKNSSPIMNLISLEHKKDFTTKLPTY